MQYIILLRGVNVGGRTIKMAELKSILEDNGYTHVQTVLQTGNVILNSTEKNQVKLKSKIEAVLQKNFNYPAEVLVTTPPDLQKVISDFPFKNTGSDFHRYIIFTENGFEKKLIKDCGNLDKKTESVQAGDRVAYWTVLKGFTLDSDFGKYLAKASTKNFTTNRNVNTLEKILAKCEGYK